MWSTQKKIYKPTQNVGSKMHIMRERETNYNYFRTLLFVKIRGFGIEHHSLNGKIRRVLDPKVLLHLSLLSLRKHHETRSNNWATSLLTIIPLLKTNENEMESFTLNSSSHCERNVEDNQKNKKKNWYEEKRGDNIDKVLWTLNGNARSGKAPWSAVVCSSSLPH